MYTHICIHIHTHYYRTMEVYIIHFNFLVILDTEKVNPLCVVHGNHSVRVDPLHIEGTSSLTKCYMTSHDMHMI